ncbi:unnamed protein product [Choristocarpus tenellus]
MVSKTWVSLCVSEGRMGRSRGLLILFCCLVQGQAFFNPLCCSGVVRYESTLTMATGFGKVDDQMKPRGAGRGTKAFERQMRSFDGLKKAGAEIVDVYAHHPGGDNKFYFAGKVARSHGISVDQSLQWHRELIVDHVRMLESSLQLPLRIFTAPGNTEVSVAKNELDLCRALTEGSVDLSGIRGPEVGFMPETYERGQPYYYCRKDEAGKSLGPPVQPKIEGFPGVI